jgi:hypothetical protein
MTGPTQEFVPKVDPGPGMVDWLTYLDSRLAVNAEKLSDLDRRGAEQRDAISERLAIRSSVVDNRFDQMEARFDKLEDLISEVTKEHSSTREEMAKNGVIATAVAACVSLAARYFGA